MECVQLRPVCNVCKHREVFMHPVCNPVLMSACSCALCATFIYTVRYGMCRYTSVSACLYVLLADCVFKVISILNGEWLIIACIVFLSLFLISISEKVIMYVRTYNAIQIRPAN
jgi:hypothetical protein